MRKSYLWDSIRWRPIAVLHICWWLLQGAPVDEEMRQCGFGRWSILASSWRHWRNSIMWQHDGFVTCEELLARLDREVRWGDRDRFVRQ